VTGRDTKIYLIAGRLNLNTPNYREAFFLIHSPFFQYILINTTVRIEIISIRAARAIHLYPL
jgi:hypothetical protein